MLLANVSIRRPVSITMLFLAIGLFGILSYLALGIDKFPEVELPTVTITCIYRGASPETLESKVVDKIEEQLAALNGIDQIRSICTENVAQVFAVFKLDRNIEVAVQDVRDKIAAIRTQLPETMENPVIDKVNTGAVPILTVTIGGPLPPADLARYVKDEVKARIQSVPGVGSIREIGLREREIKIWINNDALNAHHLTVAEVVAAVRSKNIEVPAGKIESMHNEYIVKTMGELTSVDEFRRLTVATLGGTPVTLGDVARVEDTIQDERVIGTLDGQPTIGLQVRKQAGANAVKIARAVKTALAELEKRAPAGVRIRVPIDNAPFIESAIHSIIVDLFTGSGLAVLVILLFLRNLRATVISALAIPASILATFILMRWLGLTLNMLTTMALSLCIGVLIDDAIVVIENIFRHIRLGKTPVAAARDATDELGLAVTTTTFSLVAVFVPVALMGGILGRFLSHFGITATAAVLVSLFVSFTLTPMLAGRHLHAEKEEHGIARLLAYLFAVTESTYRNVLRIALAHPIKVLALGVAIVVGTLTLLPGMAFTFKPNEDRDLFLITVRTPQGTSAQGTRAVLARIERETLGIIASDVSTVYSTVAGDPLEDPTKGQIFVSLVPKQTRLARPQALLMDRVRTEVAKVPGLSQVSVEELDEIAAASGETNKQVLFSLLGPDMTVLHASAQRIKAWMANRPGLVDVADTHETGKPELRVNLQRDRMEALGVNVGALANTLRLLIGGEEQITRFKERGKQYDVKVRLDKAYRESRDFVGSIMVRSNDGRTLVPIANVADLVDGVGPSRIDRIDRSRQITIGANLSGLDQSTAMTEIASVAAQILPPGYRGEFQGIAKVANESMVAMVFAASLAFVIVYMLLAAQFENYLHPITIMTSVPLAVVGALTALLITRAQVNVMTMIGLLMLMGLVVKNGILLVEFINRQRELGLTRVEAILVAGPIRLRPILMTSICMIGGMIPPAIATGQGSEMRGPMAIAVIGGLISSTVLTLVILPVFYVLQERVLELFGVRMRFAPTDETAGESATTTAGTTDALPGR